MPVGCIQWVIFTVKGERRDVWCTLGVFGEGLIELEHLPVDLFHYSNVRRVANMIGSNKQAESFSDGLIGKIDKV